MTVGSVIAIAVLGVYMLTKEDKPRTRNNEVTNVLTDVSSRNMGIDSLLAQIKISNDSVQKLEREIGKLRKEQEMTRAESSENRMAICRVSKLEKDFASASQDLSGKIEVLSQNLTRANEENARLRRRLEEGGFEQPVGDGAQQAAHRKFQKKVRHLKPAAAAKLPALQALTGHPLMKYPRISSARLNPIF